MNRVYEKLITLKCIVDTIDVANLGLDKSGDCVDWFNLHPEASLKDILTLPLKVKPEIKNEAAITAEDYTATIQKLATLSTVDYERTRVDTAKALGVRKSALDAEVRKAKQQSNTYCNLPFEEIEPWPDSVDLAELLTDITNTILRFIACKPEVAQTAALWLTMSWFINDIDIAPLAIITAPEKRCGKSQLFTVISRLVYRPLMASNITPAALFRSIDEWQPTLLIDEADAFMRENEELRGILNAGHTRDSAYVVRVVGDDHHPKCFNVWGAKAIAGIGKLADTLMDRGIILELRRKLEHEHVERLRHADSSLFGTLSAKLARTATDYAAKIGCQRPPLPEHLNDRAQDNWEPLLAIADVAGGQWPSIARCAALTLSSSHGQSKSISIELLEDLQDIFATRHWQRAATKMLIEELCADPEKPWATFNRGQILTPRQLSTMLNEFGINSGTIRMDSSTTLKGYSLSQFEDAFIRYLQPTLPEEVTTSQPLYHQASDVTHALPVTDIKVTSNSDVTSNINMQLLCDAVTSDTIATGELEHSSITGEN
jgi:putative DNA primase/helicase